MLADYFGFQTRRARERYCFGEVTRGDLDVVASFSSALKNGTCGELARSIQMRIADTSELQPLAD